MDIKFKQILDVDSFEYLQQSLPEVSIEIFMHILITIQSVHCTQKNGLNLTIEQFL
ncbi:hypothetical protein SDC9_119425 [bioreactor metagenome]|uniref:Uncharacterized protein n=1 Tax=bioreactor metagenome TaxID=1076179 RepID=A0A645C489_9ZZZZ